MAIPGVTQGENARERETSVHLHGLVDTVLEEGNLDSAIRLLDRLRHPAYKPYGPHIRQLLYLALYPPVADAPDTALFGLDSIPSSPSKLAMRHRMSFSPSPAVIEAAQSTLCAFVRTNTPESICRALPNYGLTGLDDIPTISTIAENNDDEGESELAKLSRRIKDARSCWDIIKQDYIKRGAVLDVPKNTRNRRSGRHTLEQDSFDFDEISEPPQPVADNAWQVLEFLVSLFEKDQTATLAKYHIAFSPYFLAQIPSSRSTSGARWDVAAPLDVIFYCLEFPERWSLGARLLTLLINLTNTIHIDLAMLLNAVTNRLLSTPPEQIQTLFSLLPRSPDSWRFQLALCQLCLTDTPGGGAKPRARPQARGAPRPIPTQNNNESSSKSTPLPNDAPTESKLARKFPAIQITEALRIFSIPLSPSSSDPMAMTRRLHLKFFLIEALAELMATEDRDAELVDIVQSGKVAETINIAFKLPEGAVQESDVVLAEDLKAVLSLRHLS